MQLKQIALAILIHSLPGITSATDTAYQWTDNQGQIHFGDRPPASIHSRSITLQHDTHVAENHPGLRPGERHQLDLIEQRQQQQQRRARAARTRADHQRATRRARCDDHREKLHTAQGRNAFKKHSRYLRNNCW